MINKLIFPGAILAAVVLAASGCYYDRESELYPAGTCDTTSVKWSTTIQPLINSQCATVGCHAGANPGNGIDLTTYESVHAQALNGALLGTVTHQPGYDLMPRDRQALPLCQIGQLRIWVNGGAPQN